MKILISFLLAVLILFMLIGSTAYFVYLLMTCDTFATCFFFFILGLLVLVTTAQCYDLIYRK